MPSCPLPFGEGWGGAYLGVNCTTKFGSFDNGGAVAASGIVMYITMVGR
jgi:hypothetical protein